MINIIVELSKYTLLTLMVLFTFHGAVLIYHQEDGVRSRSLWHQQLLVFLISSICFLILWLQIRDQRLVLFYCLMLIL